MTEYVEHFNAERPHQGKGSIPLRDSPSPAEPETGVGAAEEPVTLPFPTRVACRERLGGLFNHYRRAA